MFRSEKENTVDFTTDLSSFIQILMDY